MTNLEVTHHAAFFRALHLAERAASHRRSGAAVKRSRDPKKARLRYLRWQSQNPFEDSEIFTRRLATVGLSDKDFRDILGEMDESIQAGFSANPGWLTRLRRALALHPTAAALPFPLESPENHFLWIAAPLIHQAHQELVEEARALENHTLGLVLFEPKTVADLFAANLPDLLEWSLGRTVALELYIARLENRLPGSSPEERYQAFFAELQNPQTLAELLAQYPVLARLLTTRVQLWLDSSRELLRRLAGDGPALCSTFSPEQDLGVITEIQGGLGDRHQGGRSVHILRFSSGLRLVYKPRPQAMGVHFQELLSWLNKRGAEPRFRTLRLLDRHTHGWMEFVEHQPCQSPEELQRFYLRQGSQLALLHALNAGDIHYENIIAAGEHPVIIDLESIVEPHLAKVRHADPDTMAADLMARSVLRIGLLPLQIFSGEDSVGIDMSGLGAQAGQLTTREVPYWHRAGTDEMELRRRRIELPPSHNRPTLSGAEVNLLDYADALIDGFERTYRLLCKHRRKLLARSDPWGRFDDDQARIIVRATRGYARLIQESFHPYLLRNALDQDRHLDQLWLTCVRDPRLEALIPAEVEALRICDVPLFSTTLDSRDLVDDAGRRIPDFLDESGRDQVRQRLRGFSESDLERQLWFIRTSLKNYSINTSGTAEMPPFHQIDPQRTGNRGTADQRLLSAAIRVADRLVTLALRHPGAGHITWVGVQSTAGRNWSIQPLGLDLYQGVPGVVLFLAYLESVTGEERFGCLARAGRQTIERKLESDDGSPTQVGGFDGWGGLIYTYTHLSQLWQDPDLLRQAEDMVDRLPELITQDGCCDVTAGSAGCLVSLLGLYRCSPRQRTLDVALQCGDQVLSQAIAMPRGVGWPPPPTASQPLAGFAHGAAGIAWALSELTAASGEARFREMACQALEYEHTLFVPKVGNWRDARQLETRLQAQTIDGQTFLTAWCHGAPGIGLGRLSMLRHLDNPTTRRDAEAALRTTMGGWFGGSHCLCHGDLGNLELFTLARDVLGEEPWGSHADALTDLVLADIEQHGFKSGLPRHLEGPGLMTGLAGIGYGLLRVISPRQVPSVLLLEPPTIENASFNSARKAWQPGQPPAPEATAKS